MVFANPAAPTVYRVPGAAVVSHRPPGIVWPSMRTCRLHGAGGGPEGGWQCQMSGYYFWHWVTTRIDRACIYAIARMYDK